MASASAPLSTLVSPRTAVLASPDLSFRQRVRDTLIGMRWQVREASGGAEALAHLDEAPSEALILDSWLPDLEIVQFTKELGRLYPSVDLICVDGPLNGSIRSPRRNELLHALRQGQDADGAVWNSAPQLEEVEIPEVQRSSDLASRLQAVPSSLQVKGISAGAGAEDISSRVERAAMGHRLPEFIGMHPRMLEVSRRIRLVSPRRTPVLIQGPTGTGKELVARALHRLSARAMRPFVVLNCAAIPESLLEAELFGHTRGAFTGAVQQRVGRIEAAHGGTLFLDEIGEMPLTLQAKLLRFVECGELQRIGENEPLRVDVRLVAATHRPLATLSEVGAFRADLYYRLSVFTISTPSLDVRRDDIPLLADHFLARLGMEEPVKRLSSAAFEKLLTYHWPGNVRELEHVVERAWILAEQRPEISAEEIELGESPTNL